MDVFTAHRFVRPLPPCLEKPKDLIGTDREQHLRDLLRAIKYGLFS